MPTPAFGRPAQLAVCLLLGGALLATARPAAAQDRVSLGGTAYLDYFYRLTSSDDEAEGENGFTFRRLFVTADFTLSDAFDGRVRLEANDASLGGGGTVPFVKDLYLRWRPGGGHAVFAGITAPPAFIVSEDFWGYRSLERTILDLNGIIGSRDFGVRANGPLLSGGALRYGVMVANNSGVLPETDKHKRVYAQLEAYPAEPLVLTLTGSYASYDPGANPAPGRERGVTAAAFAGYRAEAWRLGVEAFHHTDSYDDELPAFADEDAFSASGVSVFGAADFTPRWGAVARVDRVRREVPVGDPVAAERTYSTLGIVGIAYRPHPQVRLIPNLRLLKFDGTDTAETLARLTLHFDF